METAFAEAARAACEGTIDGNELIRRTEGWTRAKAAKYKRRLGAIPAWIGDEDIKQELRIQIWRSVGKYDATRERTTAPAKYVAFSATKAVQKQVQKAQGLEQHRRSGKHRFELAVGDTYADTTANVDPNADPFGDADRGERYAVLRGLCDSRFEVDAIAALEVAGEDAEAAAEVIWADSTAKLRHRLTCEQDAVQMVRKTVLRLLKDYGTE